MRRSSTKCSILLSIVLAAIVGACASSGESGTRTARDVITREAIMDANMSDMYQVIDRLRPRWLVTRGARTARGTDMIVVYQDQVYLGGVDTLRQVPPERIYEARYMDASRAQASLPGAGMREVAGAIVLRTQPPRN